MRNRFLSVYKRIGGLLLFLSAVLLCYFFGRSVGAEAAEKESGNFTNLIVFARFSGETEFIDDVCGGKASVREITENSYSRADYSVKDYYARVSSGTVDMQTVYLFAPDGGSVTLSRGRGYYCTKAENNPIGYESYEYGTRMYELRRDWADAINAAFADGGYIGDVYGNKLYSVGDLDKNGDGYIDCLTIVYKYSTEFSVSWKDCLWNYQSYSGMVELEEGGKKVVGNAYVQLTANYTSVYTNDESVLPFAALKVMIHETGHVFGLKDLYRTQSDSPVYYMSAMSNAISPVPQYISAKEREALGWLKEGNVATMSASGTYSVGVTSDEIEDGVICYKAEIPSLNKILYLEYRKFDGTENKYDTQAKNIFNADGEQLKTLKIESGLVCFLVEKGTLFPNNLYSNSRNWNYQVLGGRYATKSDAALGVGESLQITANLRVDVTAADGRSLCFTVSGTDLGGGHAHDLAHIERKEAGCETVGNIEYWHCEGCGKYFSDEEREISYADTVIAPKGHTEKTIVGKAATCRETGLTDGFICSSCGKVLREQLVVEKLKHESSDWILDRAATADEEGIRHKECLNCGEILETQTIEYIEEPPTDSGKEDVPTIPEEPPTDGGKEDVPTIPEEPPTDGGKEDTPTIPEEPSDEVEPTGCNSTFPAVPMFLCLLAAYTAIIVRRKKK